MVRTPRTAPEFSLELTQARALIGAKGLVQCGLDDATARDLHPLAEVNLCTVLLYRKWNFLPLSALVG